jgi:UDP-glucose:(heptosyl)LPS alpha-1,3-glucosyltransferase
VSNGVADELRTHFPGVEVTVVPNGVDLGRFHPDPDARRSLRGEDDELVALFVGGDWSRKGLEIAIRAIELARADGIAVSLWVVGDGDSRRFPNTGAVQFFGRRADTERFYAAADVFVLPSSYETFSLVAYEAAASGLPVIGTAVSGILELVREGGGGLLVDPTPQSVHSALGRLASDPDERVALGARGREWANRFTWEASASATVDLYRSEGSRR